MLRKIKLQFDILLKYSLTCFVFILLFSSVKARACIIYPADGLPVDTVFTKVDKQPAFPGGYEFFLQFLGNNLKYRDKDVDDPRQRNVVIQFIVEPDGTLSNIKAIRGTNKKLNQEAIRVISISPKWLPGYKNGKPVRVSYTVPVPFGKGELHDSYSDEIYTIVTIQPYFPGGPNVLNKFISENTHLSKKDHEKHLTGKVEVQFVVEKDGSLSNFKAISGPSATMKAEAIRVLSLSPKWYPGIWEGNKFVRVVNTVSVDLH